MMLPNLPNPDCCNTDDRRNLCPRCAEAYERTNPSALHTNALGDRRPRAKGLPLPEERWEEMVTDLQQTFSRQHSSDNPLVREGVVLNARDNLMIPPTIDWTTPAHGTSAQRSDTPVSSRHSNEWQRNGLPLPEWQ